MTVYTVEYIWFDGDYNIRNKTRVLNSKFNKLLLKDVPTWNYDGSSTNQADGNDSEIILKPRAIFKNPLSKYLNIRTYTKGYIVVCDTYNSKDEATLTNNREWANKIFSMASNEQPWYGLEQEYYLFKDYLPGNESNLSDDLNKTLDTNNTLKQGPYYCSSNHYKLIQGYEIVEKHLYACIDAGIKISGKNAEVAPSQWEFQVGPCEGIKAGDHLMAARYLLSCIAHVYNCHVSYHPKPLDGDWNGSGCHTNFSTKKMREGLKNKEGKIVKDGLSFINEAILKLEPQHVYHMSNYGTENNKRMTGKHETAHYNKFSHGVGDRTASVRIGNDTKKNKCGYFEDRRPASNCDPYLVTGLLFKTCVLSKTDS